MKKFCFLSLFSAMAMASTPMLYNKSVESPQTDRECFLVEHLKKSVAKAEALESKLPPSALALEGMSSSKVRHFLNNVCSLENCTYLEIGTWKGSTLIAALLGNRGNLLEATACDNWSLFGGPAEQFASHCDQFIKDYPLKFYDQDCFTFDLSRIANPVNVYFFDGDHSFEAQEKAFTYFSPVFDEVFIAIVDDWNWDEVRAGTFAAFEKLGYTVCFEKALPSRGNCDLENYWNGLYIAVITSSRPS